MTEGCLCVWFAFKGPTVVRLGGGVGEEVTSTSSTPSGSWHPDLANLDHARISPRPCYFLLRDLRGVSVEPHLLNVNVESGLPPGPAQHLVLRG